MTGMLEPMSPSTLTYRDRLRLKEQDGFGYNSLYATTRSQGVFNRLSMDATGRQSRSQSRPSTSNSMAWPEYCETSNKFYSEGNLSGFITNTSKPVYTPYQTFHTSYLPQPDRPPIETLVPPQLRRYKQREPYEYMAAIRRDTETTNQTMRMLGTYEQDYGWAKKTGVNIPNCCPGGPAFFHPDVRLTGSAAGPGSLAHSLSRPATVMSSRTGGSTRLW